MKSLPQVIVALSAAIALSSCSGKSEQEKSADELIGLMNSVGDTVTSVKDEASAEKAATKLVDLAKQMKALQLKSEGMSEAPKAVQADIEKRIKAAQTDLETKMASVGSNTSISGNPKILKIIGPALMEFAKIMTE